MEDKTTIVAGKEKFWNALTNGGFVTAVNVIALYLASLLGAVDVPDKAMIATAITGLTAATAAAIGAYLATNSQPTHISVLAEPASDQTTLNPKGASNR